MANKPSLKVRFTKGYRTHIWNNGQPQSGLLKLKRGISSIGSLYSYFLIALTAFNGFWVVFMILNQVSSKDTAALTLFPSGFNDAVAIVPLTFLAFASALIAAQASVANPILKGLYGYAGRSLIHGFFFLGMSFILATSQRIISTDTFKSFRAAAVLGEIVNVTPAFMWINALIAALFFVGGLIAMARIFAHHD